MPNDWLLACLPAADGVAVSPCGTIEGIATAPGVIARPPLTDVGAGLLDLWSGGVDLATSGEFFGYAFATIVGVWLLAWSIGVVVQMVRGI